MKIAIVNLYGIKDEKRAYYRKQGRYCFDFVNKKELASELSESETADVLNHKEYYLKMYNAEKMVVES